VNVLNFGWRLNRSESEAFNSFDFQTNKENILIQWVRTKASRKGRRFEFLIHFSSIVSTADNNALAIQNAK
jgi:hypothetical protein